MGGNVYITGGTSLTDGNVILGHDGTNPHGNVGIGTTQTDTFKLAVNGTIKARDIVITAGTWPDYVFDESHQLTDLNELEAAIKEQKHLPGIPTAKEVNEKGVAVGDMQAKLLQKIEELTLYVINLKHENVELRDRLTRVESK